MIFLEIGIERGTQIGIERGMQQGLQKSLENLVEKKLKKGLSVAEIAEWLEESEDVIKEIVEKLQKK